MHACHDDKDLSCGLKGSREVYSYTNVEAKRVETQHVATPVDVAETSFEQLEIRQNVSATQIRLQVRRLGQT